MEKKKRKDYYQSALICTCCKLYSTENTQKHLNKLPEEICLFFWLINKLNIVDALEAKLYKENFIADGGFPAKCK